MRRSICCLSVALVLATLSPATAKTPLLFRCNASVTITFNPNWSGLTWDWAITDGAGVCRTDPLGETFDVTLSQAGDPFYFGDLIHESEIGWVVWLRLTGRSSGSTRSYRHLWYGLRLNCTTGRFVTLSDARTGLRVVPVGTGNLKFCGPFPDASDSGTASASVTWNYIGG